MKSPSKPIIFLLLLALLMAGTYAFSKLGRDFSRVDFDFFSMKPGDVLLLKGLDRQQTGSVKFGFLAHHRPPAIGVFGNHQFQYFSLDAFGGRLDKSDFFNFWYANLGLPEVYHLLRHLAAEGKLPTKLVLVQVTTPSNDMGRHILEWGGELPESFVDTDYIWESSPMDWMDWMVRYHIPGKLRTIFNINQLRSVWANLNALDPDRELASRVVNAEACSRGAIPGCSPDDLARVMLPDGSLPVPKDSHPVKNGDSAKRGQVIFWGDQTAIADWMRRIDDLCLQAGTQVVFVIPPVYEDNRDLEVDRIFNAALDLIPEAETIDHRSLRDDPSLFVRFDHPSTAYFQLLAGELDKRGYLPLQAGK